jgi:hypothetical protein
MDVALSGRGRIQMTKSNKNRVASPAKTKSTLMKRIGYWVRVLVMCLSFGFIFPHVLMEDDDIAKHDADKEATAKKE